LSGCSELYQVTLEPKHLEFAIALADSMLAKFYEPQESGFCRASSGASDLILASRRIMTAPNRREFVLSRASETGAITGAQGFSGGGRESLRLFSSGSADAASGPLSCCWLWIFSLEEPGVSSSPASASVTGQSCCAGPLGLSDRTNGAGHEVGQWSRSPGRCPPKRQTTVYLCTGTACQPRLTTRRR